MIISDKILSFLLGALTAFGFTFFQFLTLNMKINLKSNKFLLGACLNIIYGYLVWISYRAIQSSSVTIQITMALGSTFVSWLSFAIISRKTDNDEIHINKRQAMGFVVGIILTMMEEINKRVILNLS